MAWYDNAHFKQDGGIEFLVADKEEVTKIHKRLKNIYGVNVVDKSTVHELQVLKKAKRSSVTPVALTEVTQALLQPAEELITNSRQITTTKPATELSVSKESENSMADDLEYSTCALVGF